MRFLPERPLLGRLCTCALIAWLACLILTQTAGCATGRTPGGDVVLGIPVGSLPETTGEFLNAAAGLLPAPWNWVAGLGATLLVGGPVAANTVNSARRRKAEREAAIREGQSDGWDLAHRESLALRPVPGVGPGVAAGRVPGPTPLAGAGA